MRLPTRNRTLQLIMSAGIVTAAAAFMFIRGASLFTFDDESPTEAASPLPDSMSNVLSPTETLTASEVRSGTPWEETDFSDQVQALGWSETAFDVPAGMQSRVDFWKQIYAKYSTDQGVLHDPVTLAVYESVQFAPFKEGDNPVRGARERQRIVDAKKALISERLLMLQERLDKSRTTALTTPLQAPAPNVFATSVSGDPAFELKGDDLRYWRLFEVSADPSKFRRAAARIRFQLGQRDKFLLGIYYSGRYLKSMEQIFHDEGLPIELTRLPFVESSFNTRARSKVGASGIWQFMRRTAKPYLKQNQNIDERDDPLAATRAAARLMKGNFNLLGRWPLAVTAWNHGPSGVRNVVLKLATDDLSQIIASYSSRTFGFASQNFYACFLAVLDIESDASSYFNHPVWQAPLDFIEIKTPNRLIAWPTIVKIFGDDETLAEDYNPQFTAHARSPQPRIPGGTKIRIPTASAELAASLFTNKKTPAPRVVSLKKNTSSPESPPPAAPTPSPNAAPMSAEPSTDK